MNSINVIYLLLLFLCGFIGFVVIGVISLKPKLFWTTLIFAVILGTGPMIKGYGLIDEYLVGCIIVGFLLSLSIRPVCQVYASQKTRFSKIHFEIFFLFMCYLTLQSIRGLIVLDDLRMIRFIIFFMMLGILSYILFKGFFPVPPPSQIINLVLLGSLIYFMLYLGYGIYTESIRGINRFDVQGDEWTGSSVAMFPLFCVVPAVYFMLVKKSEQFRKNTWIAWIVIIVGAATSFYYDSRISWIVITGFLVFSIRDLGLYKSLKIFIIFAVFLFTLLLGQPKHNFNFTARISGFYKALFISGTGLQESDIDRKLAILASLRLITDNPKTLLFGTGFYTERYKLVPYYEEVLSEYGIRTNVSSAIHSIVRTSTFPSFIAGTGLIGIFFLFLCFYLTACEIIMNTRAHGIKGRKIVLFTLLIVFMSIFVSINLDLILFYLCIMPSGLLVQMSRYETSIV